MLSTTPIIVTGYVGNVGHLFLLNPHHAALCVANSSREVYPKRPNPSTCLMYPYGTITTRLYWNPNTILKNGVVLTRAGILHEAVRPLLGIPDISCGHFESYFDFREFSNSVVVTPATCVLFPYFWARSLLPAELTKPSGMGV